MFVRVNTEYDVELIDADDCTRFHVERSGALSNDAFGRGLVVAGAGRVDPDGSVEVLVAWVRAHALGAVADDWEVRFTSMLEYARSKGWLSEDEVGIRAHVVEGN